VGLKLAPCWPTLANVGPCWLKLIPNWPKLTQVGSSWPQVSLNLAPSWPHVGPCWPKLAPSWPQVGPKLAHVGPSWSKLAQIGPKLAPRWPQAGPCWPMLAPSEPHDGPSSKVSPRLAKVFTKALPLRPRFSQMSTKALPQAFRRLIFRSGCSIVLFSNLKVVSFWVRLSDCPVMAGLSKRFIQTFLPSGSCRQLLLEASSFFVHCTKAL
jgi:hypothetical protein